jgi:hypothetical protein
MNTMYAVILSYFIENQSHELSWRAGISQSIKKRRVSLFVESWIVPR